MHTILLINDDGIKSIGLVTLKQKLEKLGEVTIVTPEKDRSGIGKALTAYDYIKITETQFNDGSKAYAITGTPADAFLLAVNKILKRFVVKCYIFWCDIFSSSARLLRLLVVFGGGYGFRCCAYSGVF